MSHLSSFTSTQLLEVGSDQQNERSTTELPPGPAPAHLLNEVGKRLLCCLKDGRILIGILQSVDQFGNLVLRYGDSLKTQFFHVPSASQCDSVLRLLVVKP